jgi:hypothetical protein
MSAERRHPIRYEIRIAGALSEGLAQALTGMRAAQVRPSALLRIEVRRDNWDAADIVARLRERGHVVTSIRRCRPVMGDSGQGA